MPKEKFYQLKPKNEMQKVAKKYALKTYFKSVIYNYSYPQNPKEFLEYAKTYNEIPLSDTSLEDKDWFYKMIVEHQKRNGVYASQFFTPPQTAERMAELTEIYAKYNLETPILDACCGFGQLTKYLLLKEFKYISGFDISYDMFDLYRELTNKSCENHSIEEYVAHNQYKIIVSNPPYEIKEMTQFFECSLNFLQENSILILLIPIGTLEKRMPKNLVNAISKFQVLSRENMKEDFFNTKIKAEIVVLQKK